LATGLQGLVHSSSGREGSRLGPSRQLTLAEQLEALHAGEGPGQCSCAVGCSGRCTGRCRGRLRAAPPAAPAPSLAACTS
jgi:hypothetical protein